MPESNEDNFWGTTDIVFYCLVDKERTKTLKEEILSMVKPDSIVADVGSGTGILAKFALRAGAKKVYVIEPDPNLMKTLEWNFKEEIQDGRAVLIQKGIDDVKFTEKIDVVICELISTGLFEEYQVPAINHCLKYCKKNALIIPKALNHFVELVHISENFYGEKLKVVQYEYNEFIKGEKKKYVPLSEKKCYATTDFGKKNSLKLNAKVDLQIIKDGIANGLKISNSTVLHEGRTIGATLAYCMPVIIPIKPVKLHKEDRVKLDLQYKFCGGIDGLKIKIRP